MKPRRPILCGINFKWKKEQLQLDLPTLGLPSGLTSARMQREPAETK